MFLEGIANLCITDKECYDETKRLREFKNNYGP